MQPRAGHEKFLFIPNSMSINESMENPGEQLKAYIEDRGSCARIKVPPWIHARVTSPRGREREGLPGKKEGRGSICSTRGNMQERVS